MTSVTRRDRFTDLAALVLIVGGVALYLWSLSRLHDISQLTYAHPGPRGTSALAAADRARYLSNTGLALVLAGVVTAVASAYRHRRGRGGAPVS
jgi:hypothetical protein